MSYFDAIILGILQGLTEFLPVSSSGHLVLAQNLLGVKQAGVSFELMVHVGTLLAVLVYFRVRIWLLIKSLFTSSLPEERKLVLYLIIGTIPAAVIGGLFDDFFEQAFSSPLFTACMLIATGVILLSTHWAVRKDRPVTPLSSFLMGVGQAVAIFPGISRSGSTIASGLLLGVNPEKAAEFSFLLAIPAIAGAVVLKADELMALDATLAGHYAAGTVAAFVFGLFAVYAVLQTIRRGKFEYFAYYCFVAGAVGIYIFI